MSRRVEQLAKKEIAGWNRKALLKAMLGEALASKYTVTRQLEDVVSVNTNVDGDTVVCLANGAKDTWTYHPEYYTVKRTLHGKEVVFHRRTSSPTR